MKPYKVTVAVTTKYIVEVHGEDEHTVQETAEKMDSVQIANAGDIVAGDESVEVLDIELLYSEDHEDEEPIDVPKEYTEEEIANITPRRDEEFVDLDSLKAPDEEEMEDES